MQSKKLLSFTRAISTFTAKYIPRPPFSLQIGTYLEPNANHVYTFNRNIDNLIKSGSINSALKLFDEMPVRDVVTWNMLISGHGRYGFFREALCLYNGMVSRGIIESSSTFSSVLSICCEAGSFQGGLQVHCRVIVLGFSMNVYVGSALIGLYMNMGLADFAMRLFNDLPKRSIATWNLLLRGLGELGRSNELMGLYYCMKTEGVEPNAVTFCYLIRGCGNGRFVDEGKKLHCCAIKTGWSESNLFVANAVVDFYSARGSVTEAKRSFQGIPTEDLISWNSLVSVFANNGFSVDALEIFTTMQLWGKKPSVRSFVGFLNLSSGSENLRLGKQVHCFVLKLGFDPGSVHVQSALINMYGKCGEIGSSALIFENIPKRTLETCNSFMTSLLQCGIVEDVVELFGLMVDDGIGFDEVSLSTTMKALLMSSSVSLTSFTLLHCCAVKSGFECHFSVSCSLIDCYSRFGHVKCSHQVFEQLPKPNVICSTSIINAHAQNEMGMECLELLEEMIQKGLKPDKVTFLCVLTGCKHSKLVEEGKILYESMKRVHGIEPDVQHISCMVDLLGPAGLLDEAEALLKHAPVKDDSLMWSSLLKSCGAHRNVGVGRRVAEILMDLEPKNPTVWLQASKFYSEIGEFETSTHIREVAVARKMQRDIDYSLIEVNGRF